MNIPASEALQAFRILTVDHIGDFDKKLVNHIKQLVFDYLTQQVELEKGQIHPGGAKHG